MTQGGGGKDGAGKFFPVAGDGWQHSHPVLPCPQWLTGYLDGFDGKFREFSMELFQGALGQETARAEEGFVEGHLHG